MAGSGSRAWEWDLTDYWAGTVNTRSDVVRSLGPRMLLTVRLRQEMNDTKSKKTQARFCTHTEQGKHNRHHKKQANPRSKRTMCRAASLTAPLVKQTPGLSGGVGICVLGLRTYAFGCGFRVDIRVLGLRVNMLSVSLRFVRYLGLSCLKTSC